MKAIKIMALFRETEGIGYIYMCVCVYTHTHTHTHTHTQRERFITTDWLTRLQSLRRQAEGLGKQWCSPQPSLMASEPG